jgi:hypothetical protein
MITADQVQVAKQAAVEASNEYFMTRLNGRDTGACGFAWVEVYVDRTNSAQAKELIKAGFRKDYKPKCLSMWNPGELCAQNIDAKDAGARRMAAMLANLGLKAYAGSRLD